MPEATTTTTTAAQGTLRALLNDAGNAEGVENDSYGAVGSSVDFISGEEGIAFADDLTSGDLQGDQLLSGVVGTDAGGQGVLSRGGEIVGLGPTPDGSSGGSSSDGSSDQSATDQVRTILVGGGGGGGTSTIVLVVLAIVAAVAALGGES